MSCVTNPSTGCVDCPAIPHVPGIPAHIERTAIVGWNAGANSIVALGGSFHTLFSTEPNPAGIGIGFKGTRVLQTQPELIEHGFLIQSTVFGTAYFCVIENGTRRTPEQQVPSGALFEVRRVGARVSYFVTGSAGLAFSYQSAARSSSAKVVNACLYLSGDTVR